VKLEVWAASRWIVMGARAGAPVFW